MIRCAILILLFLPVSAHGGDDPWTTDDTMLEILWQGLHVLDTGTSLDIVDNPDYYEMNPAMGRHPDREEVWGYMLTSAILHPIVVYYLPSEMEIFGQTFNPRRTFQVVTISMSGYFVGNNLSIGLEVKY